MICPPHERRKAALDALIIHARRVSQEREQEVLGWKNLVTLELNGKRGTLPGYVPYVGESYFSESSQGPRILILALSQNIRPDEPWVKAWYKNWVEGDGLLALDRQNREFAQSGQIAIWPFDTGHLPVVAAMIRALKSGQANGWTESIYPSLAATNLSKWSFRSDDGARTQDSPQSLASCWDWFTEMELDTLQPDFILCAGNGVSDTVSAGLAKRRRAAAPRALKVAFPNATVINTRHGGELTGDQVTADQILAVLCPEDRSHQLYGGQTLADRIRRHVKYFADMYDRLRTQLVK